MSKYVRTKDGHIFEIEHNLGKYGTSHAILICDMNGNCIDLRQNNVLKQADTIEELCDAIVYEATSIYNEDIFKGIQYPPFTINKSTNVISAKGAIWTEWGLKYVAKMNDEGELELI